MSQCCCCRCCCLALLYCFINPITKQPAACGKRTFKSKCQQCGSLVACLCFVCPTWQSATVNCSKSDCPPPCSTRPLLCPCSHLSNTFDSVAAAGAYLSWLPGGILISVQPQLCRPLSLTLSLSCPARSPLPALLHGIWLLVRL